jgi:hypothetical protein
VREPVALKVEANQVRLAPRDPRPQRETAEGISNGIARRGLYMSLAHSSARAHWRLPAADVLSGRLPYCSVFKDRAPVGASRQMVPRKSAANTTHCGSW